MSNKKLTVVICTYGRNELLAKCLASFDRQTVEKSCFDVIVIDNKCSDNCTKVCMAYGVKCIQEEKTGLSHARNRGYREADGEFILYFDDDGIAHETLIENTLSSLSIDCLGAVGGQYFHYFSEPPPKWLRHYYQGSHQASDATQTTPLHSGQYLSGGIMAVKKSALENLGGFDPNMGMQGHAYGYGEEDDLQDRLRKCCYKIYYNPAMSMDHLVHPRKYTITSRVEIAFHQGFATSYMHEEKYTLGTFLFELLRITFITIPYDILRWIFRPKFYWQNAVVSTTTKYFANWGRLQGSRRREPVISQDDIRSKSNG